MYPLELVKTRLQMQDLDRPKYRGIVDCFTSTIRQEGPMALFKGWTPCVLRAVPVNGAIFLAVSGVKQLVSKDGL